MTLAQANQKRWEEMKVNPGQEKEFKAIAARLSTPAAVKRYKSVSAKTGVPWQVIAVIHEREASQNWNSNIAQGDPWNKRSTHVPVGRGPFPSWEDAAYDALTNCAPFAAHNKDWSVGGALAILEKFNGLGYANKGRPSPYIWSGTNQYKSGKYVSDGVYSPNAVDKQLGCAGILYEMGMFNTVGAEHTTAGGVIIAGAAVASQHPHSWGWIIAGTLVAAGVIFSVIKLIKGK
jgi:lysozyme family protein